MPSLLDRFRVRKDINPDMSAVDPAINPSSTSTALAVIDTDNTGVPDVVRQSMAAVMLNSGKFGPGKPIEPAQGFGGDARAWNFPPGYNIMARADRDSRVSFDALHSLIDHYDIARMAIGHRIDDVRSLPFTIIPKRGVLADATAAVDAAYAALAKPDGKRPFHTWLAMYLEDVLRYDAGCLQRRRDRLGRVTGLRVVSGTTIAPVLDYYGDTPEGPDLPAYVQVIQGVPWKWFPSTDLVYIPFRPQSDSAYGFAPLEAILINANTDVRFQMHFLNYFTEGTIPFGFATAPEGMTSPDQLREYQEYWDALCYGEDADKHQLKWIAPGTVFEWPKDEVFDEKFPLYLMRKTAAAYHVTPNDLGFTDDVNRSTSENQQDVQSRTGTKPLAQHLDVIISQYLQDDLGLPVEFAFDTDTEKEDRVSEATAWKIATEGGAVSPDEWRTTVYGLPIDENRPWPRTIMNARSGPIPEAAILAVSGPTDPETGAPTPTAVLPTTVFTPAPGVLPATPPQTPALAERVFGPDADQVPTVPGVPTPAEVGVAKAMTSGITGGTGIYGNALIQDDEDKDNVAPIVQSVYLEASPGDPDGTPNALTGADIVGPAGPDPILLPVVKADVTCAGLLVKADDTGRVLMLQRALDPTVCGCGEPIAIQPGEDWLSHADGSISCEQLPHVDPAAGTWEFPGGHLEDGETAIDGAKREWCEEVGAELPPGEVTDFWLSGIYAGFVYCVPAEAMIDINLSDGRALNPDDPDGDCAETVAWFDPADLPDMPSLRPACGTAPWPVICAAALDDGDDLRKTLRNWKANARGRVRAGKMPKPFPELADRSISVPIWKRLETASDRTAVDAAFLTVIKAGDARPKVRGRDAANRLPIHAYDQKITRHYADPVQAGLAALFTPEQIQAALDAAAAVVVKSDADKARAAAAKAALSTPPNVEDLKAAVQSIYGDAYLAGSHVAATMSGGVVLAALDDAVGAVNWDAWTPGDPRAALQAADGGLRALLDGVDITIRGMTDTQIDRIGNAIADGIGRGLNMDDVADSLSDVIDNPDRAYTIAATETARAITAASTDTYAANGVAQVDWLVADPCDVCADNEAGSPYELDAAPDLPAHPNCRCALAPHIDESAGAVDDSADVQAADEGDDEG